MGIVGGEQGEVVQVRELHWNGDSGVEAERDVLPCCLRLPRSSAPSAAGPPRLSRWMNSKMRLSQHHKQQKRQQHQIHPAPRRIRSLAICATLHTNPPLLWTDA